MYPQYETKYMIRQTWCSVGSIWKPRLGHPCGETTKTICLEIPTQDRDIYFKILILNKNERKNINIGGSRQDWVNTQSIKTRSRQMQA